MAEAPYAYMVYVLDTVNWVRAQHTYLVDPENPASEREPLPPLVLDSTLNARALTHAKNMANAGYQYHSGRGIESVKMEPFANWTQQSGNAEGTFAVAHNTQFLDPYITKLGVGMVEYKGNLFSAVCSTTAG